MYKLADLGFGSLGADDTTAEWRALCAPMYEISPTTPSAPLPFGSNITYQIGDLVTQRSQLSTQRIQRDRRRVDAGPDHYMVQLYR